MPCTQNLGAVSDCLAFRPGGGSPKTLEQWLSEPEALGMYDLKSIFFEELSVNKLDFTSLENALTSSQKAIGRYGRELDDEEVRSSII